MSLIPLILATALTSQSHAQQFDLLCVGEHRLGAVGGNEATYQIFPLNNRIRIDLEKEQFCWNECNQVYGLIAVDDNFITLNEDSDDISPQRVNRRTGEFTGDGVIGSTRSIDNARCEREPFSGFPAKLF